MSGYRFEIHPHLLARAHETAKLEGVALSGVIRQFLARYGRRTRNPSGIKTAISDKKNLNTNTNKTVLKKQTKQNKTSSSQAIKLAALLESLMKINNTSSIITNPQVMKWAEIIDLIHGRDGKSYEEIKLVLQWSHQDDFWRNQILSATSLRKHWNQLSGKMQSDHRFMAKVEGQGERKQPEKPSSEPKCPDCGHLEKIHCEPVLGRINIPKGFRSTKPKVCAVALQAAREGGSGCMCGLEKEEPAVVGRGMC